MGNENGIWVMHGLDWNDPLRIRTPDELISYIDQVGFLPLFANEVPGFSVEDHVSPYYWWTDDPEQDPWKWREILARSGRVLYGKFFNRKAGFVSRAWFPDFANYRRDGYDFDALWDDELASARAKKIMDQFETAEELYGFELRRLAGFGKGGEKNFDGVVTDLQMKAYLIVRDLRQKRRKSDGAGYGWPVSVYTTPERLLGYDAISAGYEKDPMESKRRIFARVLEEYPWALKEQIEKVMR